MWHVCTNLGLFVTQNQFGVSMWWVHQIGVFVILAQSFNKRLSKIKYKNFRIVFLSELFSTVNLIMTSLQFSLEDGP